MSGGSKGSQQTGTTTSTQAPPSYMFPSIGTALGQAGNLLQSGGPQYYPQNQVAGFSQPQQQAFGNIQSLAGSNPLAGASRFNNNLLSGNFRADGSALGNLQQMGTGSMNNPELGSLLNLQNQGIQNSVNSQYAGSGRNVEQSMPVQQQQMGNADSSLLSNAYNINQGNALAANQYLGNMQQGAVGQSQNLLGSNLGLQNALGGVGQQVQGQAQNLINADQGKYNFYQQEPYQQLQQYEQFLGGVQPGMSQTNPYFTNPTANALGEGAAGLSLYNGIKGAMKAGSAASDRRLKEDIKRIGSTDSGLPIYTYRYKGQEQVQMGVMADEVRKVQPEAVTTMPNGFDAVYYGMLK